MQSLLQTNYWAEFKATHGWQAHEAAFGSENRPIFILERELGMGKTFLYAPEVSMDNVSVKTLSELAQKAHMFSSRAICFRLELFNPLGEGESSVVADLTKAGYRKAFEETQPEHRQQVDISKDETTILAAMKEKGRYNVKVANRKGVEVRFSADTKDVEVFYELFRATAGRNGFAIRSKEYFESLCEMLFRHKLGELVIATYEGQPLTALIITYYDGLASYLYGASSNEHRNVMAPYKAHFEAMKRAQKRDCTVYDLLQVAPANASANHHYVKLTQFKERFGGERVDLIGGWDYVYQPFWYQLFKLAQKIRRR